MDMEPNPADILKLGHPALRRKAVTVESFDDPSLRYDQERLCATLKEFRRVNGFGRAISAPQIGSRRRLIAVIRDGACQFIVNPHITWASTERFTMWDDCMSFPSLLVRLARHRSISIHFQNEVGEPKDWEHLDTPTSELLQHEVDHLDGVLAVDRAIDKYSIIMRSAYLEMPEAFRDLADYEIPLAAVADTTESVRGVIS